MAHPDDMLEHADSVHQRLQILFSEVSLKQNCQHTSMVSHLLSPYQGIVNHLAWQYILNVFGSHHIGNVDADILSSLKDFLRIVSSPVGHRKHHVFTL